MKKGQKSNKLNKLLKDNDKLRKQKTKHLKEIEKMNTEGGWDHNKELLVNELRDTKNGIRELHYSNMENVSLYKYLI